MAAVTVYSSDKVDTLTDGAVVGGTITDGHLVLQTQDGSSIDVGAFATGLADASDTVKGKVELATDTESIAGTDTTRAVTPFGLASVVSSTTLRGLVELATSAETITGTDTVRAVTPAGLFAVLVVSGIAETAVPSLFPFGVSVMALNASTWSLNSGSGSVVTSRPDTDHAEQTFYSANGLGGYPRAWNRQYNTAAGGWSAWQEFRFMNTLTPGTLVQTSAFTSYPQGESRMYFTSTNSTGWDFAGKYGELLTYRDGTDFAKQTWTWHANGPTGHTEQWIRTANAAGGWTPWLIAAEDTGWVTLGTLGSTYTLKSSCDVRRIHNVAYLRGAFTAPTGGYTATGLVLPVGFRPSSDRGFPMTTNTAVNFAGNIVASTGVIQTWADGTSTSSFHISGVNFPIG